MGLTDFLARHITHIMQIAGYPAVFAAMVMESMVLPVPSEAVMPFAGFLIAEGRFTLPLVVLISTLASLCGSLISYAIGYFFDEAVVHRYGGYFLLDREELEATKGFFNRYGDVTVFVSRFIPVIRHLISIPAGFAEMNLFKFTIFTLLGAALWNTFLAVAGMYLRSNWEAVMRYSSAIDIFVVIALAAIIAYFVLKHVRKRNAEKK